MSPSEVLSARESPKHAPASSLLCLTICSYCSSSTRSKTASSSSILTPRPARANLSSSPASLALSAREALRLEGRPDMALSGHVRASPALVYVWGAISAHATTNLGRVRGGGRPVRAATGPPSPPRASFMHLCHPARASLRLAPSDRKKGGADNAPSRRSHARRLGSCPRVFPCAVALHPDPSPTPEEQHPRHGWHRRPARRARLRPHHRSGVRGPPCGPQAPRRCAQRRCEGQGGR